MLQPGCLTGTCLTVYALSMAMTQCTPLLHDRNYPKAIGQAEYNMRYYPVSMPDFIKLLH